MSTIDTKNPSEMFDLEAGIYQRMTGRMAPGKSAPIGYSEPEEDRRIAWEMWLKETQKFRAALMGTLERMYGEE